MIQFKDDAAKEGFSKLHPIVIDIVNQIGLWSNNYDKKPITITESLSTPERDKKLNRVSPAHSQGRAVDIRTSDMPKQKLILLMQTFTDRYRKLGYLTQRGDRRLMYYHDSGNGPHIHLAIGLDVIEKYKNLYPNWSYPVHKQTKKELKNG
jgi:hypothetical protein